MFYGALNPLPDGVQLAVADEDKILFRAFVEMKGREAAKLPGFVEEELQKNSLKLEDVKRWSVGAGPGGFTALRMTAALAAAWVMGFPDRAYRCIPSAVALAAGVKGVEGETLDCLFDGRNHEVLLYALQFQSGEWTPAGETAVLNSSAFAARAKRRTIVSKNELDAVRAVIGDAPVEAVEPDAAALIGAKFMPYDSNPDKIVYIREAVEQH